MVAAVEVEALFGVGDRRHERRDKARVCGARAVRDAT